MEQIKFNKDKHYEERIVQALIVDHQWAEQMVEVLNVDYFNVGYLKETVEIIFDFYYKHKSFPSFKLLATIIKSDLDNDLLRDQIIQYLIRIKKEPLNGDMPYVKEESLDFCKKRSLAIAMENCLDLIEDKQYDSVVQEIQKALVAGSEKTLGHDYLKDFESRMIEIVRNPVPTPYLELNKYFKGGGFSGGELVIWMAASGVGKSHVLVDVGATSSMRGFNVAHYTLELSERDVGNRYDARLSGVASDHLIQHKDVVENALKLAKGHIIIKSYPTKSASVLTIKNHIHQMILQGVEPDLIVVDYGDLMRSTRQYDQKRLEEEHIFEELRGLAMELDKPIHTATQANRSGFDEKILLPRHVAECIGKYMICDAFITFTKAGNLFLAKNRLGPDGIIFPFILNTATSRMEVFAADDHDVLDQEDTDTFERLRSQYKKLKEGKN